VYPVGFHNKEYQDARSPKHKTHRTVSSDGLCTGGRLLAQTFRVSVIIIIIFDTIMIIIIVVVVRSC
jgi:hypothetical protein